jgi:hypothetical protein
MLSKTISYYPKEAGEFSFTAVSGTQSIRQIPQRGCEVQIGSAEMPDAIRSFDISMAHLSEIALWPETQSKSGDDLAQALYAAIPSISQVHLYALSQQQKDRKLFSRKLVSC